MYTCRTPLLAVPVFIFVLLFAAFGCGGGGSDRPADESDAGTGDQGTDGSGGGQGSKPGADATVPAPEGTPRSLKFKTGQNNYSIIVDGLRREFIIHVPRSYNRNTPAPLVFVFHESAHNGAFVYERWKWREKCDSEGCIAVFPTALKYFVIPENATQTKWNDTSLYTLVPPGTPLADDVKFVRNMVETAKATFNVDAKRVYATGGSNGGRFVTSRILIELPDVFAAAGISQLLGTDGLPPRNNEAIPAYVSYGNLDPLILKASHEMGLTADELPMEAAQIMQHPVLGGQILNALKTLGLDSTYTVEYCAPKLGRCAATYVAALEASEGLYTTMTFAKGGKPGVEFRFRLVKGMGHSYALASNNPAHLVAADFFWDFFKEHPKP